MVLLNITMLNMRSSYSLYNHRNSQYQLQIRYIRQIGIHALQENLSIEQDSSKLNWESNRIMKNLIKD